MRRLLLILALSLAANAARAQEFGRFGLSLKMGECAGAFGIHAAYNLDRHWQLAAGVGGTGLPMFLAQFGDARTDSYFLLGRAYLKHLYFSTGYSLKRSRVTMGIDGIVYDESAIAHGIPFHLGYEFGRRRGFFFATSIGFLYVFKGGGETVKIDQPRGTATTQAAQTSPSIGVSLGYYFTEL